MLRINDQDLWKMHSEQTNFTRRDILDEKQQKKSDLG